MDKLASLIDRLTLRANVFNSGPLCDSLHEGTEGMAQLHVLHRGKMQVRVEGQMPLVIEEPALLLLLHPLEHRITPLGAEGADTVCCTIDFGSGFEQMLMKALPEFILLPLNELEYLSRTLHLLFAEAFADGYGKQAALNRLCELLVIQLIRLMIDTGQVERGLLAGLADKRLGRALTSIHDRPAESWTLNSLAREAGMSRARFAMQFRDIIGLTPGDYLQYWRLGLVKTLLLRGDPLSVIAYDVGYSSPTALTRAFTSRFGLSPSKWLKQSQNESDG